MKRLFLFNVLIVSVLSVKSQNILQVQMSNVNYINTQQSVTQNNTNVFNNQVQVQNRGNGQGSALQNLRGNNINQTTTQQATQQKVVNRANLPRNVSNTNTLNNVADNNVGNVVTTQVNNNPVKNDNKVVQQTNVDNKTQTTTNKPVNTEVYQGMDFKPSGLSGRDYSNGGKMKKGQKNFYTPTKTKYRKAPGKRRPVFKKVKHHTSKCARW